MGKGQGSKQLTALVTGAGAPLGVSIVKAFRQSVLNPRILATDADPLSVGLFRADAGYVLPRIDQDEGLYLRRLENICLQEEVDLVCFGSEIEMSHVAPHVDELERNARAKVILNQPRLLQCFMDKWETIRLLRENDLPVPDTVIATDPDAVRSFLALHTFPLVLKPRRSAGSKNLVVLRGREELDFFSRYVPDPVLQEYLFPDDEEYTVGVYKSTRSGYVGQIVLKRRLGAGLTYKAEVVFDKEIETVCRRLVESFDLWGPINVQLRKTSAGVRIFEVNPRFSSSAVMRAGFGFNEAELCLRDVILGETKLATEIRPGIALRYWDEIYLATDEFIQLCERGHVGSLRSKRLDAF